MSESIRERFTHGDFTSSARYVPGGMWVFVGYHRAARVDWFTWRHVRQVWRYIDLTNRRPGEIVELTRQ